MVHSEPAVPHVCARDIIPLHPEASFRPLSLVLLNQGAAVLWRQLNLRHGGSDALDILTEREFVFSVSCLRFLRRAAHSPAIAACFL